jgi:hypothetical protein
MRRPADQAAFFKLLATLLGYMASGRSITGYLKKAEWNPYYKLHHNLQVCRGLVPADS